MVSIDGKKQHLQKRLKAYALRIIRLYEALPKTGASHVITRQLLRSGTSPGAQYREACRAKSDADFISKIEGALQELDESDYWLELLVDGGYQTEKKLKPLRTHCHLRQYRQQNQSHEEEEDGSAGTRHEG